MTLILQLGNCDQVIHLSDRRLSSQGKVTDPEANKAFVYRCRDAVVIVGYTGLARTPDHNFATRDWLVDQLRSCSPPEYKLGYTFDRLCERATKEFSANKSIKSLNAKGRRLSIMFCGYVDSADPPLNVAGLVSNFENLDGSLAQSSASDSFQAYYRDERQFGKNFPGFLHEFGAAVDIERNDVAPLLQLLRRRRPASALIEKGVEFMRNVANRPSSDEAIGREINSVTLPRADLKGIKSGYHAEGKFHVQPFSDLIIEMGDNANFGLKEGWVKTTPKNK